MFEKHKGVSKRLMVWHGLWSDLGVVVCFKALKVIMKIIISSCHWSLGRINFVSGHTWLRCFSPKCGVAVNKFWMHKCRWFGDCCHNVWWWRTLICCGRPSCLYVVQTSSRTVKIWCEYAAWFLKTLWWIGHNGLRQDVEGNMVGHFVGSKLYMQNYVTTTCAARNQVQVLHMIGTVQVPPTFWDCTKSKKLYYSTEFMHISFTEIARILARRAD